MRRDSVSATPTRLSNCTLGPESALLQHLPMVRILARRIHGRLPRGVDLPDLYSAGLVGLMEAFAKFDPTKEIQFASYANFRIRGAILDSLRKTDWAPRALRRKEREVEVAIRTLSLRLGHPPTEDEVAFELKMSLDAYQHLLGELNSLEVGTLHRQREDGTSDEELEYAPGPLEDDPFFRCMRGEIKDRLTAAIQNLSERERQVTTLYYYEEMNVREIGITLGLDPLKVMRIRTAAVLHLRAALSDLSSCHSEDARVIPSKITRGSEHAFMPKPAA